MLKQIRYLLLLLLLGFKPLISSQLLLEFKGAYFLPKDSCVREIFGHGAGIYGPEITFGLAPCSNWYGFASIDFLKKKGCSVGLSDPTKMDILPLVFGLKYFVPFGIGDFYIGLGFQPLRLKTENNSQFVVNKTSKWGFGGIAKIGTYINLPCNFFLDIFVDYSFVKVGADSSKLCTMPLKVNLDAAIFGAGIGYRFN